MLGLALGTYYPTGLGFGLLQARVWFLGVGVVVGLYGMGSFLALTHRRVASPWLLLGLLPAGFAASTYLGLSL